MRIMKKTIIPSALALIAVAITFSSCKKDKEENLPTEPVAINISDNQKSMITSGNTFAFDIFKKVAETTPESKNIIISPLSISTALLMTLNGANGTTKDAMLTALRENNLTTDVLNSSSRDLVKALLAVDKRVLITIANSVWTENSFVVKKPFSDALTQYFDAEAKSFNINDPAVPSLVNTWIDTKTNGLIKKMIDQLDDNTVMLLINAIYFKGKWSAQFDKNNTVDGSFYLLSGSSKQVPMMKQNTKYKIFSGDGVKVAELPYGQGNYVMDVILPDNNKGVNDILAQLNVTKMKQWTDQMVESSVDMSFPRFKYVYETPLKDVLTDMGMGIAFTDNADFSNISDEDLLINKALHKAFIETNEEGTEAAAVTIIGIGTTSMPMNAQFTVDHPFIYVIRETTTNSILFMGRVSDPLLTE
jgi:serine protease inhibitor